MKLIDAKLPLEYQDASRKGRCSDRAPWAAKLSEAQVREIKSRLRLGNISRLAMSSEYGVSSQALDNIAHGVTWRHVA